MTLHTKVGGAWKTIADGNLWVKDGGTWRNTSLETKVGGVWKPIHTGSDKRTYAIPTSNTRSFRSSAGGSTGAWITSGYTNGANSIRQGKYGGKGAYDQLGYSGGSAYVISCYPNTYEWVGVMAFSDATYAYDITDGWGSKTYLPGWKLSDLMAARPVVKGTPKLHLQRVNTASNAGQTGGEGYATGSGNVYIGEYNAGITATTPSLSSLSASNQVTYNPGSSWFSRGEKIAINLTSTIINNVKTTNKNLAVYGNATINTNDQGLRDPDNPTGASNSCWVYRSDYFLAPSSQTNYFWYYHHWTGIADPSSGTVSGPFLEVELDFA